MAEYGLDQAWYAERDRLNAMSAHWDPGTELIARQCGLGPGHRVLEVGAGAGSVARIFADIVGLSGHVVAADIDTRLLADIDLPHVEVRTIDVRTDDLPVAAFDLVHARMVIEHLADHKQLVLKRLATTLKPGGWLFIEDVDWFSTSLSWPPSDAFQQTLNLLTGFMTAAAGYDSAYGRTLLTELRALGLTETSCGFRGGMLWADPAAGIAPYDLMVEQLMPKLISAGRATQEDADRFKAITHDGVTVLPSPIMFAAVGRA